MLIFFLLSVIFTVNADVVCSNGYEDGGDDVCYKVYSTQLTRPAAAKACHGDGGNLVSIPTAFINSLVQSEGYRLNLQTVWLGLTCETDKVTSCEFDDSSTFLTDQSFTNFSPGNPNPNVGSCIFMATKGGTTGRWYSADCDNTVSAYACSIKGGNTGTVCSAGYTLFEGKCYKAIAASDETTAESTCVAECGHITSVLSADENTFVRDLAGNFSKDYLYARIGLTLVGTNTYAWLDGSVWNQNLYNNFGLINPLLGSCVGIALKDEGISQGQWINIQCDNNNYISVCKKETGQCDNPTNPTLSPVKCPPLTPVTDYGTLYSPGYPNAYETNQCEYFLISSAGYLASIRFTELNLDGNSVIQLYNDIGDFTPFQTLTGSQHINQWFTSTENEMKVIFSSPNGGTGNQLWKAEYQSVLNNQGNPTNGPNVSSGCNQGVLNAPGTITSPNYPKNYPDMTDCNYQLQTTVNKRVSLWFNEVITEPVIDVITVYDGTKIDPSKVIARISGKNPNTQVYYSTSNTMLVTFITDAMDSYKGFSASFSSV